MGMTRRSFLGLIGGVPLAASLASGCGFFSDLVGGDSGDKTVNVAVFLPQGEGANFQAAQAGNILASLQTAANEINDQSLGFRVEVNLTVVPPGPAFNFAAFFGTANANAEPTPTPFSPIADTLNEAAASGQLASGDPLPDILMISNMNELPLLYAEGIIEPFEQATRVDGSIDLSAFAPGALEAVTWQGQVLVLPLSSSINTLTYDTDLFANAGVAAPSDSWSWTEMIEAGKRLTYADDSGTQWGTYAHASVPMLLSLIWSHGGEVFSAENGAVRLAEPEAIRGIELWRDMMTFHQIAPNPPAGTFAILCARTATACKWSRSTNFPNAVAAVVASGPAIRRAWRPPYVPAADRDWARNRSALPHCRSIRARPRGYRRSRDWAWARKQKIPA